MAIVKRLPGNPGPVNQGEEVVLAHLEKALPNSFTLIPNITISFERDGAEEYDIVAVGPDGVIVVEVKTIFGSVEITEQTMIVDGDVRSNPWKSSRIKAQKLASRLSQKLGDEPKTWVEHVVVFLKPPLKLEVFEGHKDKIFVGAETLVPKMMPPSQLIHHRGHGLHANRTTQIVDAITGGSSIRQVRRRFGEYFAREKVNSSATNNQIEYWYAEHRRHGGTRKLDVYLRGLGQDNMGQEAKRIAEQRVTVANQIGPSADVISSYECFETEAGEFVVVWPSVDSPPLAQYLTRFSIEKDAEDKTPIADADARKMLEGFASAYSDLHQAGFIFGDLSVNSFVVRPTGRGAIVLQHPIPVRSGDHRGDLEKLAEVANAIVALSTGATITEVVKRFNDSLKSDVRAEWASAGWLAAACQVGVQSQVQQKKLADLFEDLTVIATHTYGKTYTGINKETKKKSVIRVEKDRPGDNWVRRESDVLKRDELRSCLGAVQWLQSGQVEEGYFVETQFIDGVSMTSILDAKLLENHSDAAKATLQILEVLNKIHPDLEKLDELVGSDVEPTNDQLQKIMQIRSKGVAHNHIEPNNVIWVEGRGPVLVDFARAAEIGRVIPVRLSAYWPPNDDRAQSNPTADLYAVGLLLLAMLTGSFNPQSSSEDDIESRLATVRKQKPALAAIIEKAIAIEPQNRFRTAKKFIDALVSLDLKEFKSPQIADVLGVIREVEELVAAGKFDQALAICTRREWYETAEQIKRKKDLVSAAGQDLVNVDGVRLTYLGTREVGPGTTGSNRPYLRGSAHVYLVRNKDGGVLEAHTVTAKPLDESGKEFDFFETWVQGDLEYGLPVQLQMLADRRRLVVNALNKQGKFVSKLVERGDGENAVGDLSYCQIRQLQLKDLDPDRQPKGSRWEATNKKVNESQLRAGAAGADVFELLKRFGAVGVGTRQDVISDESKLKGDLCVKFKFGESAIHIPIIVFLVTRFLPLKNKVAQ